MEFSINKSACMSPYFGVYDVYSAILLSRYTQNFFLSGYSFASSFYGLPDIGFVSWQDMVGFCSRLYNRLPESKILVDIDDGYGGPDVVQTVAQSLHNAGAFGVVIEDQKRPKKCGHLSGKSLQPLVDYIETVEALIEKKGKLFVVARTDAEDFDEQVKRVNALSKLNVDAILVDGISLSTFRKIRQVTTQKLCFNYLAGGKASNCSLDDFIQSGVNLLLLSTPCLFSAASGINNMIESFDKDGLLPCVRETLREISL